MSSATQIIASPSPVLNGGNPIRSFTQSVAEQTRYDDARFWLGAISDGSDDANIGQDLDGIVTSWNRAAKAMFGYRRDEIVGHPVSLVIPPERMEEVAAVLDRIRCREKSRIQFETGRRCRDGRAIPVLLTVSPVHDDRNRLIGFATIARDLRPRDEQERQFRSAQAELERLGDMLREERGRAARASRSRSSFLAGMSHELRTPLNGMLGYAQLLLAEGGLTATQRVRVDGVLSAGRHLLEMITCVLDLAEIDAEHVVLRAVPVDVAAIASACLDLIRPAAEAKGVALKVAVTLGASANLVGDPMRLRQALLNLLTNAVRFTTRDRVEIRLQSVPDCSALRIEVTDSDTSSIAPGAPAPDMVDPDIIDVMGPRLAVASRLVSLMGGRLRHADIGGGGALFCLELPIDTVALPVRSMPPLLLDDQPPPARALHVLVVDDIAMNRDIAASFLRSAGHEVTCVEGGTDAVSAVAETGFDVVLMDVRMPGVDGLEATRRIRSLAGSRGRVPIVALTAESFPEQVAECRRAGMNDHLPKPFDPDSLHAVVVRAFAARYTGNADAGSAFKPNAASVHTSRATDVIAIGMDVPVFDLRVFERATIALAPEMVASHLRMVTEHAKDLLSGLHVPDALSRTRDELAEAALMLAGSGGLLGFKRLTAVGRRFERAVRSGGIEVNELGRALSATLEATLKEINERMSLAVSAGLGLALSARLAASVGGRRGHMNNAGGSVFWMEMPLDRTAVAAADSPTIPSAAAANPARPVVRVLNVLVVDDIAMNRDIADCFLRAAGHRVTCAEGGAAAVSAVELTDFDVVLMDVRMPGMDGLEATRRIRAMGGVRGMVPIVALTANAFAEQVAVCREAGMNDHVAKPFDQEILLAAVNRATTAEAGSAPVAVPPSGEELPVFDRRAFDRTAIFLAPEVVAGYLQTIAERGEPLLRGLWGRDALKRIRFELADAAHTLAGSAGMLGFERLASLGCLFDRAVRADAVETPAVASGLSAALEATLQEIHERISATLGAGAGIALSARLTALMADRHRREEPADDASTERPAVSAAVAVPTAASGEAVADPPVLDAAAFERTAAFLTPEAIASYFQTLTQRGDALLRGLTNADARTIGGAELVAAAHTLAGSAGLLGFKRLAFAGRNFEHAVKRDAAEVQALAQGLKAAIEATLKEIHDRTPAASEV